MVSSVSLHRISIKENQPPLLTILTYTNLSLFCRDTNTQYLCLVWATIYHIWLQRNNKCFGGVVFTEEQIIHRIKWDIRAKMGHVVMAGNIMLHKVLSSRWGCLHLVTWAYLFDMLMALMAIMITSAFCRLSICLSPKQLL